MIKTEAGTITEAAQAQLAYLEDADTSFTSGNDFEIECGEATFAESARAVPWIRWRSREHHHSPMLYTQIWFKVYRTGDWEHGCTVHNRSGHSDWDVWLGWWTYSTITNRVAFNVCDQCWFQDLDHGERFNKSAAGFNTNFRDSWNDLWDGNSGTIRPKFRTTKRRDN